MATLKQLAELTGLSMNTVSRAIRGQGYISEKTRKLVREAVRKTNYQPHKAARELRKGSPGKIMVLMDSGELSHQEKLAGIREEAVKSGFETGLYLLNDEHPAGTLRFLLPEVLMQNPAGIIFISRKKEVIAQNGFLRKQLPCIYITGDPPPGTDCVFADYTNGVIEAVNFLYSKGRRRIACCQSHCPAMTQKGYAQALKALGLPDITFRGTLKNPVLVRNTGYLNGKMFAAMDAMPDAVLASEVMIAGLLAGFASVSLRVPEQVALISFENSLLGGMLNPPVTALAQPDFEMGCNAVRLLLKRLQTPQGEPLAVRLRTALLLRQTT